MTTMNERIQDILRRIREAERESGREPGSVTLVVGGKKTRVKTGGSFCLHPQDTHYLINTGKTRAKVLWVATPPSF